jgi:hypothetical protein
LPNRGTGLEQSEFCNGLLGHGEGGRGHRRAGFPREGDGLGRARRGRRRSACGDAVR